MVTSLRDYYDVSKEHLPLERNRKETRLCGNVCL